MNGIKTSVIIPCYNEEEVITDTYRRTKAVIDPSDEIIFINDGSKDATFSRLKAIAQNDFSVKVISFSRNFGHQAAVSAGINYCTGDVAFIIDADLQDPPELFPDMLAIYRKEQCNVVYGVRTSREGEGFFKKITAKLFYKIINRLSDVPLPKDAGDFRLIDRAVIGEFRNLKEKNKYIRGLISWIGFKQCPFYYDRAPRQLGSTKYPFAKMFRFATNGLLYFTKKPLSIAIAIGFLSILVGLGLAVYTFIIKLETPQNAVPGWASTIITIIFFGGIQLLSVGVLGKYIGSVFDEVKGRPEYIVESKINL
ncbi:MAG TPA: glycosyltransferase family 2 protein [Bacteroidales bacterium]